MPASFVIIVHCGPYANQAVHTAANYAQAVVTSGHQLKGVFFYQDAVLHASEQLDIASDELDGQRLFMQLKQQHQVPLLVCVTAAEKRGINIAEGKGFTIAGLAEFAALSSEADRLVQFK